MIKKEPKLKAKKEEKKVEVPQNTPDIINHTLFGVVQYKDYNTYAVVVNGNILEIHTGVDAFNVASKNFAQHFKP